MFLLSGKMTNKFVAFFATPRGQATSGLAALVAASAALMSKYLPNSLLVEQMRDLMQLFKFSNSSCVNQTIWSRLFLVFLSCMHSRDGFPVPVSADTLQKINQAKIDLKLEKDIANRIPTEKAFTVFGFDVLHIGSATFRSGALLGIPINFSYKSSISDADKKKIVVRFHIHHQINPILLLCFVQTCKQLTSWLCLSCVTGRTKNSPLEYTWRNSTGIFIDFIGFGSKVCNCPGNGQSKYPPCGNPDGHKWRLCLCLLLLVLCVQ